jgi:hypothetical protein
MNRSPRISLFGLLLVMTFIYAVGLVATSGAAVSADACMGYALCR